MAKVVFAAKRREKNGKGDSKRLRKAGLIPAVMYGNKQAPSSVVINSHDFLQGVRGISESTIVQIDVDGESHEAFVKDTQRNIITGQVEHVDFYEIERGKILRTMVPLRAEGNPVGVRNGGVLELPLHGVEVECLPKDLPERIIIDVSNLDVQQTLHVSDLKVDSAVKVLSPDDQVVALVRYMKEEVSAAPTAEAAAGEAAAGAEGEAAAGAAAGDATGTGAADAKAPAAGKAPAAAPKAEKK
jgi:large subunit ribosomal protein L25